jgi:hypothetical protein
MKESAVLQNVYRSQKGRRETHISLVPVSFVKESM